MYNEENKISIAGYGKGSSGPRVPVEAPEGISTGRHIAFDPRYPQWVWTYLVGSNLILSKSQIKVLDLISEGEIQGLASGKYVYSGNLGDIGWSGVNFVPNIPVTGGTVKWLQSVYWNEVPVADDNGLFNFQQVGVNYAKGLPNGTDVSDHIVDELTVTRLISERLRGGGEMFYKAYRISDKNCLGAIVNIRVNQLSKTSSATKTLGDLQETEFTYNILYRPIFANKDGGAFILAKNVKIFGKVSSGFVQSNRIDFDNDYSNDDNALGWEIKIVRITPDSTSTAIRNQSFVDSITEIYGSKFIYPNSAIVSSLFDAEYFSQVPNRNYDVELLKVKVPSNYDPIRKTYDEHVPWSGLFKTTETASGPKILKQWTDNPVWCYYDLLTNKRYGLGSYIDEDYIDKFALYQLSKYCDTIVSDGYGGLEPRFTCNLYITSQEAAYKVVNAMASIFRGITYYSAGQIYSTSDVEKQPVYQFTNANVIDGDFNYSDSAKKARHTVAIVRYNDKRNFYKSSLEYVEDIDSIRKYGLRDIDVPAYGCTSRGQAIRLGRWALLTEGLETESISFKAGIETAGFLRPGDIFQVYDSNRYANRLGGRATSVVCSPSSTSIILDAALSGLNAADNYKISILTPTYFYDSSLVSGLNSNDIPDIKRPQLQYLSFNNSNTSLTSDGLTRISVNSPIDFTNYHVSGNPVWMIEASGNNIVGDISNKIWDSYRVINIKEIASNIYEINGLEYDINKFIQIESGFSLTDVAQPNDLSFASPDPILTLWLQDPAPSPNSQIINYSFSISSITNIESFKVIVKTSPFITNDETTDIYTIAYLPPTITNGMYIPSDNGTYYFRVYAVGKNGKLSPNYAAGSKNIVNINPVQDIVISSLRLQDNPNTNSAGTISSDIYSERSPSFIWQMGLGTTANIPSNLSYRITVRPPTINNIPSQEIYFTQSGFSSDDLKYQFNFTDNYNAISNLGNEGPFRAYDIVVEAATTGGYSSAGGNFDPNRNPIENGMYSNPYGYDILYVNNPKPLATPLWTGTTTSIIPGTTVPFYSTGKATQQWITQDGEIKIFFTDAGNTSSLSGFFGDDIAGGTLYYSSNGVEPISGWRNMQTYSNTNPIIAPVGITDNEVYIAIAPFDDFDIALSESIPNYLATGLNISNSVKISRIGNRQSFKAWIQFDVGLRPDNTWGLINNWRATSYNVERLVESSTECTCSELIFKNPMPNTNYAIMNTIYIHNPTHGGFSPSEFTIADSPTHVIAQYEDRIIISPFRDLFPSLMPGNQYSLNGMFGRTFLGVINND